jgi:hypothetical protein
VDSTWLLLGEFASGTYDDLDALGNMQQIEVDFGEQEPLYTVDGEDDGILRHAPGEFTLQDQEQQIQDFWQVLQERLPHATHVVLSQSFARPQGTPLPPGHRMIAERCPRNITTYVSFLQKEAGYQKRLYRSLWQQVNSNGSTTATWKAVALTWTRQSVLPPPKTFRGPVGTYSYFTYCNNRENYLHHAGRLLLPQAMDEHYEQNYDASLLCSGIISHMRAELLCQETIQATDTFLNRDITSLSEVLSTEHDVRLSHMKQQNADMLASMRIAWGEEHSQQRVDTEHAFLHQLQHDPLYATETTPTESMIWYRYRLSMDEESYIY